jgi:hypothetical protein
LRIVGLLLFFAGAAATAWAVRGSFADRQPRAALLGLLCTVTVLLALAGLLLVFVPDFFT